jgi:hypothetical protein
MKPIPSLFITLLSLPMLSVGCYESPNRYEAVNNGQGGVNLVRVPKQPTDSTPAVPPTPPTPTESIPATSQPAVAAPLQPDVAQLQARVRQLEIENAQLRRAGATTSP